MSDPDTYWHIATGKWILAERAFPRHDIFSHTAFGRPWVDLEWLAQVILFVGYDLFGWRGLVLLSALVTALTFAFLYLLLARELRATVALGASAISFLFASNHFLARPHLLTFPIIVVWTAFLARASEEGRRPGLWLLPLIGPQHHQREVAYATLRPLDAPAEHLAPAPALDHALKANVNGPVLNDYDFGGYLIFRGIPTFIDGRTLFFGKQFALDYFDATALGAGDKLEQLADAYKVSWTLLRSRSAPALHFDHSPGWRRIYADDVAVVHVRR